MAPENNYTPPNDMPPAPIHRVLVGQKALVTGASKGLGQSMAIGLAQAGADVLVNYHSDEEGARWTAREIEKLGRKAVIFQIDVPLQSLKPGLYLCQVNVIDDVAGSFSFPRFPLLIRDPSMKTPPQAVASASR